MPIGLSVASLLVAILSAFKADLFDFSLTVIGGDIALMHSTEPNATHSGVLVPLHFSNRGYGEGIVLDLTVEVTNERQKKKYLLTPLVEVDLQKLLQNAGRLHGTNTIGPFFGFSVASRQVISKAIAFGWVNTDPNYSQPHLEPGFYTFDVFVGTDRATSRKKTLTFRQEFTQKQIDSFVKGSTVYLQRTNPYAR